MKGLLVVVGLVTAMAMLAGCGGGSTPVTNQQTVAPAVASESDISPTAVDAALVGTWVIVHVKVDGTDSAPKNFDGWPNDTVVRETLVFNSNGTVVGTYYNAGGVDKSQNGTWTASAGHATLTWEGSGAFSFTYTVSGNVASLTLVMDGHTRVGRWVKVVTLSGHDAGLVGTWKPVGIWRNGVSKALAFLSSDPTYKRFARRFDAAGTTQRYFLDLAWEYKVPLPASQTWASGGGTFQLGTNQYSRVIYLLQGGDLYTWQTDDNGNTIKIWFKPYGAAGGHDSRFLGPWHPVSGKVDGVSTPLATIFNWDSGIDSARMTWFADGTMEEREMDSSVLTFGNLKKWSTSGTNMTLVQSDGPLALTFNFTSSTVVKVDWTEDTKAMSVVFNKGN